MKEGNSRDSFFNKGPNGSINKKKNYVSVRERDKKKTWGDILYQFCYNGALTVIKSSL